MKITSSLRLHRNIGRFYRTCRQFPFRRAIKLHDAESWAKSTEGQRLIGSLCAKERRRKSNPEKQFEEIWKKITEQKEPIAFKNMSNSSPQNM